MSVTREQARHIVLEAAARQFPGSVRLSEIEGPAAYGDLLDAALDLREDDLVVIGDIHQQDKRVWLAEQGRCDHGR